ncbi:MAG: carbohydrate kinase, partial [Candidatus Zixiibacteriota bacterium]
MGIRQYPRPGRKIDATGLIVQGGGPVATAMVAMARLGMKPAIICAVGDDIFGRFVIEQLRGDGVDTSHVIVKRGRTAIAVGWVEMASGRRTIALDLNLRITPRDINPASLPEVGAVHLDGRDLPACLKLARWARRRGIAVSFDIGSMRNDVTEILPLVDHLVCARDFALPYTGTRSVGDAIRRLRRICPGTIVVTSGTGGSLGYSVGTGLIRQRAFRVKTVDTTGAGDAYHGGYLVGLLRG